MKQLLLSILVVFVITGCGNHESASAAILVLSPNGTYTVKPTLAAAATAADTVGKTIVVTSALSAVQSNISSATMHAWPANRGLRVEKGGSINPTTKFTGLRESTPEMFGAVGDGVTEESAKVQKAINAVSAGDVNFGGKTYIVANLQLRTGVNLIGHGTTLKLPNNATASSINGSLADSALHYPGNVIGTTLNHDGGAMYDGGTRAKDPNNSTYIVTDVIIRGFIIDGNKANNTLGDVGENGSAMGACISLHQAARVTVENCVLKNARLDGVALGYSLHGGSDYCVIRNNYFSDNGRTGMALITGKENQVYGNTVYGAAVSLDVESNIAAEINYRHDIFNNYFGGVVSFNAQAGIMQYCKFHGNTVVTASGIHGIWIQGGDQTAGMIVDGNIFIGTGDNSAAFNIIGGINSTGTPINITNNTISGYDFITTLPVLTANNIIFRGNNSITKYGFQLIRPFRVNIDNNTLTFSGGASTSSIFFVQFDQSEAVPNQGEVLISNNKVRGSGVKRLITSATGYTPPTFTTSTLVISDNDFDVTSALAAEPLIDIDIETTLRRNKFNNFNTYINFLGTFNGARFIDNEFINTGTRSDLFSIPSLFKRVVISGNRLVNINLKVTRPQYCSISNNTVRNGKMVIAYVTTSGGVGSNVISGNQMVTDQVIDLAFEITGIANTDWAAGDFSGNDIIMGNVHAGPYTAGSSLNTTPKTANYNSF